MHRFRLVESNNCDPLSATGSREPRLIGPLNVLCFVPVLSLPAELGTGVTPPEEILTSRLTREATLVGILEALTP